MATIIRPADNLFEPEWRIMFEAKSPSGSHVVLSGCVNTSKQLVGTEDDHYEEYAVQLLVGPYWKSVDEVVPFVSVHSYENSNSDEDDEQGWAISDLMWTAENGPLGSPYASEKRILLTFTAAVKGENSQVWRIGYYVTARGRELGQGGLNTPSPYHPQ